MFQLDAGHGKDKMHCTNVPVFHRMLVGFEFVILGFKRLYLGKQAKRPPHLSVYLTVMMTWL
jgi:hypothetical protein